ncbi:extracellular catalytic domain type 1 short-chain-length polyhydroxyalkanoate depolymerase [Actinokineospora xionganensis]|uniref:PHB depolymerase family esterase n=1 Tax=Actinokineospora xionganensis TaxID=2684470 RepID=A0ABR7L046_9PSEU|nr:PHB depolymerase family esterase [Actinokineospora xionganensis]MBC6445702.1 PHB depolymerase family esterase [Actinokineospora xionganensis]
MTTSRSVCPPAAMLAAALAVLIVAALSLVARPKPAEAATLQEVTGFGTNPGNLRMFRHVPTDLPAGRPLVVALHGCTQNAAGYGPGSGWIQLADQWKFSVLIPEQKQANNANSCFNWFEPGDTRRDSGEALSLKQMVDRMRQDLGSTSAHVSGLSAGGAMAAVMLATYPEVFAGGGVVAGLPFGCATTVASAYNCMNPGVNLTPAQWGDKVRAATAYSSERAKVSIWHGSADGTVRPMNGVELVEQWTNVVGTDQVPEVRDMVAGYPHRVYGGMVEIYDVTGMGHGHPVDPGSGDTHCGTAGSYMLDVNICASYHMARFWGLVSNSPTPTSTPTPAPTSTSTPPYAEVVNGTATDHYVAGRVNVSEYNVLGARYGYNTVFALYRCGSGWTDKSDCSPI